MVSPQLRYLFTYFHSESVSCEAVLLSDDHGGETSSIAISYFPVPMLITLYIRDRQSTAIILIYGRGSGDNISLRWDFFLVPYDSLTLHLAHIQLVCVLVLIFLLVPHSLLR